MVTLLDNRFVNYMIIILSLTAVTTATDSHTTTSSVPVSLKANKEHSSLSNLTSNTLAEWQQTRKQWQDQYSTQVSLILMDTHQHIVDGPHQGKGRNLFWWDLTVKQPVWDKGTLIVKTRGSNTDGTPPNGIDALVRSQLTTQWAAYETELFYVANVYLEQKFLADKLLVAIGKLGLPYYFDDNRIGSWDFFSHSLIRNRVYPHRYHTISALARYDWNDRCYTQIGINDGDGIRSETGLNTAFDGDSHWITQMEFGVKALSSEGHEGNYRLQCWNDNSDLKRHDGSGYRNNNLGIGLSCDQMLTSQWGVFFRCGFVNGKVNTFQQSWSLGATCRGFLPERELDTLGLGIAQGITHEDYREAYHTTSSETLMELYYKIKLNTHMSVQLDLISVFNPGTNPESETTIIPGVRLGASF